MSYVYKNNLRKQPKFGYWRSFDPSGMSHNNQSDTFFYFIAWLPLIVFAQNFFFIDWIKASGEIIFRTSNLFFSGLCTIFGGVTLI